MRPRPPVVRPEPGRGRLPRPNPARDWPRDGGFGRHPDRDGRGGHIGERHADRAPNRVIVDRTINNTTIVNNINVRVGMGHRLTPGGYYWYYDNGMRWAHHYDHRQVHWFGFYVGGIYFWTRWHNDRLWWQDAPRGRWLYYREGQWWYQDPMSPTVVYIYREGDYYRYTPVRGGYEARPEAPPAAPGGPDVKTEFYSEDGSRLVKILGDKKEAFLYDATGEDESFKAFLAEGVEAVQFAGGSDGAALQILLTVVGADGAKAFKLYDAEGREFGAPSDSVDPEGQLSESPSFKTLQAPDWR